MGLLNVAHALHLCNENYLLFLKKTTLAEGSRETTFCPTETNYYVNLNHRSQSKMPIKSWISPRSGYQRICWARFSLEFRFAICC